LTSTGREHLRLAGSQPFSNISSGTRFFIVLSGRVVFEEGAQAMTKTQQWHINKDEALVLQQGTGDFDIARGYYDGDDDELHVLLEALDAKTRQPDPYVEGIVVTLLKEHWPNTRLRIEVV